MQTCNTTCTLTNVLRNGSDAVLRGFLYDIFATARTFDTIREAMGARLGVTGVQFHLLIAVHDLGPVAQPGIKALAEHLRVAAPNVTVEVAKLVDAGLLIKRRDGQDGRAVNIRLTRKGADAIASVLPFVRDINDTMFAGLDPKKFDTTSDAIADLRARGDGILAALSRNQTSAA